MDSIRTTGLSVRLGRREILRGMSLEIPVSGQIVGLFGPNGAGKTTLIRCLVGLVERFSGQIEVPHGSISYMPDHAYLYDFLRVSECLDLFRARYRDFSSSRAEKIFARLGVEESRRVGELSKGMKEQLHLALTFSRSCSFYVLDEPLASVDPYTRDLLLDIILEARAPGSTILVSTHIIHEVERIFDEVVMIADGRLLVHDTVQAVRARTGMSLEDAFKREMSPR